MKKTILTALVIILTVSFSYSQEFGVGGVHRGGTGPVMKQRMKDRLKEELKLTDDQANTVTVIQHNYLLKSRAIKIDTKTTDKEKVALLQPIEEERRQNLKDILTDEQIIKLDEFSRTRKKIRGARAGART